MRAGYLRKGLAEVSRSILLAKVATRLLVSLLLVTNAACGQSAYVATLKTLDKGPGQEELFHQLSAQEPFKRLPDPSAQGDVAETLDWLKSRANKSEASARYSYAYSAWLWAAGRRDLAASVYVVAGFKARWDGTRCADPTAAPGRILQYESVLGKPIVSFLKSADKDLQQRVLAELSSKLEERFADNPKDEWLCNGGAAYFRKYAEKHPEFSQQRIDDPSLREQTIVLTDDTIHPEFISDEEWRVKRNEAVAIYRMGVRRLYMVEDEAGKTKGSGVRTVVTLPKPSRALAWSPDGKEIAVLGLEPEVYVVKVEGKNVVRTLTLSRRGSGKGIAYSPNGRYLAAGLNTINVWDAHTGAIKAELVAPFIIDPAVLQDTSVISLVFSPDSQILATTFWGEQSNRNVLLYRVETGEIVKTFQPPAPGRITAELAFSSDGQYVVNARTVARLGGVGVEQGRQTRLDVWQVGNGKLQTITDVHTDNITALAMARQGTIVATGTQGGHSESVRHSTTNAWITFETRDPIKLWDIKAGVLIKELQGANNIPTRDLDFSPDGNYLLSCQGAEVSKGDTLWLWEIATGTVLQKFRTPPGATYSGVLSCAFSPDGSRIAAVGADELIIIDLKFEK